MFCRYYVKYTTYISLVPRHSKLGGGGERKESLVKIALACSVAHAHTENGVSVFYKTTVYLHIPSTS